MIEPLDEGIACAVDEHAAYGDGAGWVDAEVVALHHVPNRKGPIDLNAEGVSSEKVPRTGGCPSDRVVGRWGLAKAADEADEHTRAAGATGADYDGCARGIGAEEVAGNQVACCAAAAFDEDALELVTRDDVAGLGYGATNGVVGHVVDDHAPTAAISFEQRAGNVEADEIAFDRVATVHAYDDPAVLPRVDGKPPDHAISSGNSQASRLKEGDVSIELDLEHGVGTEAGAFGVGAGTRLGIAVDDHRDRNHGQL